MKKNFLWKATTLDNKRETGVLENDSSKEALNQLKKSGYYQISLKPINSFIINSPLPNKEIIDIIGSIRLLLDSGISIIETLDLLTDDKRPVVQSYVFCKLRNALHEGKSLEEGFKDLHPLFSSFFIAMISLTENTGKLGLGLKSLEFFYNNVEERVREMQKILRYPKIVTIATLLISLGVVIFIIPMFKNIYALYKGDLPFFTSIMVSLSDFVHQYTIGIGISILLLVIWAKSPLIRKYHPWILLFERIKNLFKSSEDPFLYAHAMKILLDSGQPVNIATQYAMNCMSDKNRKFGLSVTALLNAGHSFSEAFQEINWFPEVFQSFIASAEKAGLLASGFERIYIYIERQRKEKFSYWSKFVEPILMLVLGCVILVILLSIYLPIFDLGNRLG